MRCGPHRRVNRSATMRVRPASLTLNAGFSCSCCPSAQRHAALPHLRRSVTSEPRTTRGGRGERDEALRWLRHAVVDRGFLNYRFMSEIDPALEGIRGDQRFSELMTTARRLWAEFEA
jgi:hypothetical protein